jgi:hypothetical protein
MNIMNIDYTDADRRVYERELRGFLPEKIMDAHIHIFDQSCLNEGAKFSAHNVFQKFGGVF